jgi:ribose 5-phosphate isomerase A
MLAMTSSIPAYTQDQLKSLVALRALDFLVDGTVLGVGTGSTVNKFIALLGAQKHRIKAAVSSSTVSEVLLREQGIEVLDCNQVQEIPLYVDGADEINHQLEMIKGGGAALTREKIVAAVATTFVCIVDASKVVQTLGKFALPVEVIPMAREYVARELRALGGEPVWREHVVTDNGNIILDVHGLVIEQPKVLEERINQIVGVVSNGLFARRGAQVALVGGPQGVYQLG